MLSHSSLTAAQKDALAQQELAGCARPAPRMLSYMLSRMLSCSGVTKGGAVHPGEAPLSGKR